MEKIAELYADNFGVEHEEPKFKGTMELPAEAEAAVKEKRCSSEAGEARRGPRNSISASVCR